MLTHGKRIICYLAKVSQDRCVEELIVELEHMDSFCSVIDKNEVKLPFYRYTQAVPQPPPAAKFDTETYEMYSADDVDEDDEDSLELNQSSLGNEEHLDINVTDEDSTYSSFFYMSYF